MARTHIHFAIGLPGGKEVVSGMRVSCDVIIEVDVEKAMKAGIEFQRSSNNVILSKGINGIIPPIYFKKVNLRSHNNIVKTFHEYEYGLVIDFQRNTSNFNKLESDEIIEFTVVPVNLKTREILKDRIFHQYVKPTLVKGLTDYCLNKIGVKQEFVDSAEALDSVFKNFYLWKKENQFDNSVNIAWNWEMDAYLKIETQKKGFEVQGFMNDWVNLIIFFQSVTGKQQNSIISMLDDMEMKPEEGSTMGIIDGQNVARLVQGLLNKGGYITSVFKRSIN